MTNKNKTSRERIELSPHDWLSWSDEEFNNWRRLHDFPYIVDFLFETLPYFSLWLSEQSGLTRQDLIFHGPARFIRFYGEPIKYIEHDVSITLNENQPVQPILRYCFLTKGEKQPQTKRVARTIEFSSYIDWAFSNRNWMFPRKVKDLRDIVRCLTPSGRSCNSSNFINSNSSIDFNIPLFMPSISIEDIVNPTQKKSPPTLELIKLGGGNTQIFHGIIGEKNLEFANIDNLTLISPVITSHQDISYSTLRNLNISGDIHAAKLHQCSTEINISEGSLSGCKFEYGDSVIYLKNSTLNFSSIKGRHLKLRLKETEVTSCSFDYSDIFDSSPKEKEEFNRCAKMIYSHLGYPDLAGKHFFFEQKSKRKMLWNVFSRFDKRTPLRDRASSLFRFFWMTFQELYWGYGERPFNIIYTSLLTVISLCAISFFDPYSTTHLKLYDSMIFAFQSFTNISIKEIQQKHDIINLIGSFMSFFGVMSIGLLVAALSAKTKNYN